MPQGNNPYNTFNYYNPGSIYGSDQYTDPRMFGQTPLGDIYLEANRDAAYSQFGALQGFRDNTALGDYFRAQQSKIGKGYEAAMGNNPNLKFRDYLNNDLAARIRDDFARLTPDQRGESFSRWAPRARNAGWGR